MIYKSSLTSPSKIIIIFHAEIIEVVVSNLRTVITNRVSIIDYIFKISNKGPDEVLVPYGKRFQFLGGFFITKVLHICVNDVKEVFNTFIAILV